MGKAALVLFLAALGTGLLDLVILARSALHVYRALSAALDDYRAWAASLAETGARLSEGLQGLERRAGSILESLDGARESAEDIREALEELRSSPLLRAARFIGKHRAGS